jgi:hypothetical protein
MPQKSFFDSKLKTYILKVNLKGVRDPSEKMNVGHVDRPTGYRGGWAWAVMAALGGWASLAMGAVAFFPLHFPSLLSLLAD